MESIDSVFVFIIIITSIFQLPGTLRLEFNAPLPTETTNLRPLSPAIWITVGGYHVLYG